MHRPRSCLLAAAALLFLALAYGTAQQPQQRPPQPTPPPDAPPPPKADKAATEALEAALKALDSPNLGWVETTLWERIDMQGLTFFAEGRYLAGPGHRLRMDLKVRQGTQEGRLEMVCDGKTLWEVFSIAGKRDITRVDLTQVGGMLKDPQVRDEFFQNMTFRGVVPLLKGLKARMTFTKKEAARWNGVEVQKLTGEWTPFVLRQLYKNNPIPPRGEPGLPRLCYLYLGAAAPHWPYRLELWGPNPPRSGDVLLLQLEFRDPHWTPEMSAERVAREFSFDPGPDKVVDRTEATMKIIKDASERKGQAPPAGPGGNK